MKGRMCGQHILRMFLQGRPFSCSPSSVITITLFEFYIWRMKKQQCGRRKWGECLRCLKAKKHELEFVLVGLMQCHMHVFCLSTGRTVLFLLVKSDLFLGRDRRRCHKLADGVENDFKLLVVSGLQFIESFCKFFVA